VQVRLVYSARPPDDVICSGELTQLADPPVVEVVWTFTREAPQRGPGTAAASTVTCSSP